MTAKHLGSCVDCPDGAGLRKVTRPGPRCATHHRARRQIASERRYEAHIKHSYGIDLEDYQALWSSQDGHCAICQRATGATRRLSVDHDHAIGDGDWRAVRGLLCRPCNKILGHLRDDPEAARRLMSYLENPPAQSVLAERRGL